MFDPIVMGKVTTSIAVSVFPFATSTSAGAASALVSVRLLQILCMVDSEAAVIVDPVSIRVCIGTPLIEVQKMLLSCICLLHFISNNKISLSF